MYHLLLPRNANIYLRKLHNTGYTILQIGWGAVAGSFASLF